MGSGFFESSSLDAENADFRLLIAELIGFPISNQNSAVSNSRNRRGRERERVRRARPGSLGRLLYR
jgi:hypothetical protein